MIQLLELHYTSPEGCVKTRICTSSVLMTSIIGLQTMSGRKRFFAFHSIHFMSTIPLKKNIHIHIII